MTSNKNHRVGVLMHEVLRMMFHVNTCWKRDCIMFINSYTRNKHSSSNTYRKLIKGGYLAEYEPVYPESHEKSLYGIQNKSNEKVTEAISEKLLEKNKGLKRRSETGHVIHSKYAIVEITQKGINYLGDKELETAYYRNSRKFSARFSTNVKNTYIRQLMISRAMTFMASAGAAVFPCEKPSLYRLYGYLNNEADRTYGEKADGEGYPAYSRFDREECIDLMNDRGAFYTKQEFSDFLNTLDSGERETIKGSRAYGVYLSNHTAFLLYEEVPTGEKEIGVRHEFEMKFRQLVNRYFQNALKYRRRVPYSDDKYTDLYTAVISDGESTVYSIAAGVKYGRVKLTEEQSSDMEKRSAKYNALAKRHEYSKVIGVNKQKYPRVFVTPANDAGVLSMNYLCHHSIEDYFRDCAVLIKSRPDLFVPSNTMQEPFVFGWEKTDENRIINVVFMPVYEINLLRRLSLGSAEEEDLDGLAVICQPEMADTISHTLTRTASYYDMQTLGKVYIDNEKKHPVAISASDMELIQDLVTANRILGNGEVYTREQLQKLKEEPTLKKNLSLVINNFSVTSYNAKTLPREITQYSRSGIALNGRDKFSALRSRDDASKKRYRHKPRAKMEIVLDESEKKEIRSLARALNLSMTQMVLIILLPAVREMRSKMKNGSLNFKGETRAEIPTRDNL